MPNALTSTGLETKTQAELIQEYTDAMKAIYGDDINLGQDTPDGQAMMIHIQNIQDMGDLLKQIFNSFDPDAAIGTALDRRIAINGIQRKEGTYSLQYIDVEASQALSLQGLDDGAVDEVDAYTVSDNNGNRWFLVDSFNFLDADTETLLFRAEFPGALLTDKNSINVPVSVVLGVESVNNPDVQFVIGVDEESDYQVKIRRQKSVGLSSSGYQTSLEAALGNLDGVTYAIVHENDTSTVDADGLPPNSIWVIVSGTAEDVEIATTILKKRSAGVTMVGDEFYVITLSSGNKKTIRWDTVEPEDLFIKMTVDSIDGITEPNLAMIRSTLPTLLQPTVNEKVNVNTVASLVQQIDKNAIATNIELGKTSTGPFSSVISPTTKKNQFVVSSTNIILLGMILTPSEIVQIDPADTRLFVVAGGYGAIVWSLETNESGGSINSVTGLYTAGAVVDTTDVVRATDSLGNYVDALVGVS